MPRLLECGGEGDRGSDDGADCRGTGAVEECTGTGVGTETIEMSPAQEHEREGRRERDDGREKAATDACRGETDDCNGEDNRSRGELTQRDPSRNCAFVIQW